jgi:hypothetical protein
LSLDTRSLEKPRARRTGEHAAGRRRGRNASAASEAAVKLKSVTSSLPSQAEAGNAAKLSMRRAMAAPSALRRSYLRTLAPLHKLWRDRHVEKLLFRPSSAVSSHISRDADGNGLIYDGPIPGQVLDWVIESFDLILRECAFVDFRAGRGRTLLYAAMHDFDRVIGYEYNPAAHEDAVLNISQFPRTLMKCRDVECRRGDQGDIAIPNQPLVLFFPNAARERFMSLILDHVSASYRLDPRRIYVILENGPQTSPLGQEDIFYQEQLPLATRLKLRMFSPVDIHVYRSIA